MEPTTAETRAHPADLDWGLVPWILSCIAWMCVPLLPLLPMFLLAASAWAVLAGAALVLALGLVTLAALRARRPSEFTIRSLRSLTVQTCVVALLYVVWKML
ncbi:MAG: hypothetical protein AB7O97_01090 [Planctomycetota bacterium]